MRGSEHQADFIAENSQSQGTIRAFQPADLEACRALWAELTERHREIYDNPPIGGDHPGLWFDEHLARVGPERVWVAERAGQVAGLVGLIVDGQEAEVEPIVVASARRDARQGSHARRLGQIPYRTHASVHGSQS